MASQPYPWCFCRAILSCSRRTIKSADYRDVCQMGIGVRAFPAASAPTPEVVLRKLFFHHVPDNVVVNYLLLALLAVHEAVDAGFVDEPGAA
jgi:hypothetical protein